MFCTCSCQGRVPLQKVAPTPQFNCMVCKLELHALPGGSNQPCQAGGAYVDLHPYGTQAFRRVLLALGIADPAILIPRYGSAPRLELPDPLVGAA
jgi:hypothetical protein